MHLCIWNFWEKCRVLFFILYIYLFRFIAVLWHLTSDVPGISKPFIGFETSKQSNWPKIQSKVAYQTFGQKSSFRKIATILLQFFSVYFLGEPIVFTFLITQYRRCYQRCRPHVAKHSAYVEIDVSQGKQSGQHIALIVVAVWEEPVLNWMLDIDVVYFVILFWEGTWFLVD